MDQENLKRLRERYTEAAGNDYFTERFQKMSKITSARSPTGKKPYSGIPTLLDVAQEDNAKGLDVALIGVPMDLAVTNRSGARFGPRAVRSIERIGPLHHVFDVIPDLQIKVADIGDVPFRSRFSLEKSIEDIENFYTDVVATGAIPLSVGGDHSVTYPIMKALGKNKPMGMVHIDAHMDTGGEYDGSKFHHGAPFRNAVLAGVLDPERCIQIGIRGAAEIGGEFSFDSGMTVIHMEDFSEMGIKAVCEKAKEVIGDEPFYFTIDVDGIDPAYTPGTGTPEVGGLTPHEVQTIIRSMVGKNIIGGDVVEIAPQYDANTNTVQVGGQLLFELLSLITMNKISKDC
jgi:agmatinase